ncbi:MAG: hypothetical protein GYA36_19015 [Veillonellaceae bacterium]|nr:hypothetical protein [Veillonellaceae bacterium]
MSVRRIELYWVIRSESGPSPRSGRDVNEIVSGPFTDYAAALEFAENENRGARRLDQACEVATTILQVEP